MTSSICQALFTDQAQNRGGDTMTHTPTTRTSPHQPHDPHIRYIKQNTPEPAATQINPNPPAAATETEIECPRKSLHRSLLLALCQMHCFIKIIEYAVLQRVSSTDTNVTPDQMFERLRGRHFPSKIPATEKKLKPQKRCVVCFSKGIRKESRHQWGNCEQKPGLCPAPCFMLYHAVIDYSQK